MIVTVEGSVRSESGEPVGDGVVSVWQAYGGEAFPRAETGLASDGGFALRVALPDGTEGPPILLAQVIRGGRILPTRPAAVHFPLGRPDRLPGAIHIVVTETPPVEPTLSELGAAVAQAAGLMQGELSRYPVPGGAFGVDLELVVPVATSVDELGRFRARVAENGSPLRFTVRHLPDAPPGGGPGPVDIAALGVLNLEQTRQLRLRRIYEVGDLMAILNRPAAFQALTFLDLPERLIRERAALLLGVGLPLPLAKDLVASGVGSVDAFLAADPKELAAALAEIGVRISAADLAAWQRHLRRLVEPPESHVVA